MKFTSATTVVAATCLLACATSTEAICGCKNKQNASKAALTSGTSPSPSEEVAKVIAEASTVPSQGAVVEKSAVAIEAISATQTSTSEPQTSPSPKKTPLELKQADAVQAFESIASSVATTSKVLGNAARANPEATKKLAQKLAKGKRGAKPAAVKAMFVFGNEKERTPLEQLSRSVEVLETSVAEVVGVAKAEEQEAAIGEMEFHPEFIPEKTWIGDESEQAESKEDESQAAQPKVTMAEGVDLGLVEVVEKVQEEEELPVEENIAPAIIEKFTSDDAGAFEDHTGQKTENKDPTHIPVTESVVVAKNCDEPLKDQSNDHEDITVVQVTEVIVITTKSVSAEPVEQEEAQKISEEVAKVKVAVEKALQEEPEVQPT